MAPGRRKSKTKLSNLDDQTLDFGAGCGTFELREPGSGSLSCTTHLEMSLDQSKWSSTYRRPLPPNCRSISGLSNSLLTALASACGFFRGTTIPACGPSIHVAH